MIKSRLTFSNVVSCIALFVALGGVSYAAITIPANSVGSAQLKNGQVMAVDINPGTRHALRGQPGAKGDGLPVGWGLHAGLLVGPGADLRGANLESSDLSGVNLMTANLNSANLTGANLTGANLSSGANLTYANLTDANLTDANLNSANLTGATLTGANLTGANLAGATMPDGSIH
jgi:hypothetical protein